MKAEIITLRWKFGVTASKMDEKPARKFLLESGGVYLWLHPGKPKRTIYVGEAGNFWDRTMDHFINLMAGRYKSYRITEQEDFWEFLSNDVYGTTHELTYSEAVTQLEEKGLYFPRGTHQDDFRIKRSFLNKNLSKQHRDYLRSLEFSFATLFRDDKMIPIEDVDSRRAVESILLLGLWEEFSNFVKVQTGKQKKWVGLSGSRSNESPFGTISQYPKKSYQITHECNGKSFEETRFPSEILAIKGYNYVEQEVIWKKD